MGVAVVTGAGRGIGREIARRLAARGLAVLCSDVDAAAAEQTARDVGGGAWAMALDVRDPDAHRAAAAAASERGRIEVWVNNAGVLRTEKAWEHADEDVRTMVEANLLGVVWGSRAAVEAMRATGGGDIVNVASLTAFGPVPGLAVYAATKHAVLAFTASLRGDLDDAGIPIRVHVVCPDSVDTGMIREREADDDSAIIWSAPRILSPAEVAEAAVELVGTSRLVRTIPRWRGALAISTGPAPRAALPVTRALKALGRRRRERGR